MIISFYYKCKVVSEEKYEKYSQHHSIQTLYRYHFINFDVRFVCLLFFETMFETYSLYKLFIYLNK